MKKMQNNSNKEKLTKHEKYKYNFCFQIALGVVEQGQLLEENKGQSIC